MLKTGVVLADRYQLDEPIAAGGVGQVWRATDLVLQRPVAIKLLRPEYADHGETVSRFRAEARHAGSLAHPGIAQVYDFGDNPAEGPPYLVMELVDGPSLADMLATEPVTPAYALDVLSKAAVGLAAAHEAGLVHRDIKPGNILLGRDGQVKITDFGIAHAVGSAPVTDPGLVMGTTQYLAPERIAGGSGTPAADLYSLGIVMHECLTGTPPYEGTPAEVMAGHLYVPLPPLPAGTPPEVEDLVARLTAKDPDQRITDANELAALASAVHAAISGAPMPRQRPAPAISPVGGVAPPADLAALADPARMPASDGRQVPQTGDMILDPNLARPDTGEHPYARPPYSDPPPFGLVPGGSTPSMGNPYADVPAVEPALGEPVPGEPADGHGTVALPQPDIPDLLRETSVDLGGLDETSVDLAGLDETSVDLAGLSQIQAGAQIQEAGAGPDAARTTSVDLAGADLADADDPDAGPEAFLGASTDPFETESAFGGDYPGTGFADLEDTGDRPRGRRRAAIGIGVLLLTGGGLAGAAASGALHASPVADRTTTKATQPALSAVQPNAGTPAPGKTKAAKSGKRAKPYAPKHAKASTTTAPPVAPASSSAPEEQQQATSPSSPSSGGTGSGSGGSSSPSNPGTKKPKPAPSGSPSSSGLLGISGL